MQSLLIVAALLGLASAAPDKSISQNSIYVLRTSDGARCASAASKESTDIKLADCNGDDAQLWYMPDKEKKQWKNVLTGKCLTINSITFDTQKENKVFLQDCSDSNDKYQRFMVPPQAFVNSVVGACIGPCNGGPEVCSFSEDGSDWCVAKDRPAVNEKMAYERYCNMEKAQGEWKMVNETECTETCGRGKKQLSYECAPLQGGFQYACCEAIPKPPMSISCNTLPCNAPIEDFWLLRSPTGNKCLQVDGNGPKVTIADCTGDDSQLWAPTTGKDLVNRKNQLCLTVPEYFSSDVTRNVPTTSNCMGKKNMQQQFDLPLVNSLSHVCVGKDDQGGARAYRDTTEDVRKWCSAGGTEMTTRYNKEFNAVMICSLDDFAAKCGGAPSTKPATPSSTPSPSTTDEPIPTETTVDTSISTPTTTTFETPTAETSAAAETTPATATIAPPPETQPAGTVPAVPTDGGILGSETSGAVETQPAFPSFGGDMSSAPELSTDFLLPTIGGDSSSSDAFAFPTAEPASTGPLVTFSTLDKVSGAATPTDNPFGDLFGTNSNAVPVPGPTNQVAGASGSQVSAPTGARR
eukprot:comp22549_c0_seq1/m.34290 comp22549_c0_seq1/g.34290  ORF comp22549_c0_seq1/g.34290 comp22549_c0_seq1/m.34290 type:complete len:579 (-) comp22549_c0_seq1:854-2590(-)